MSDKSPSAEEKSPGVSRKPAGAREAAKKAPSFDEVMEAALAPPPPKVDPPPAPPKAQPAPQPPQPEKKRSAQPSFDDIMSSVSADPTGAKLTQPQRASRPPRPREERKAPIVVRKPQLGAPPEAAALDQPGTGRLAFAAARGEEAEPAQPGERPTRAPRPAPQPREEPRELAESVFAQPSADESADFAQLFAQAEQQRGKPGRLKLGQKLTAKVAHLGAEVAFLDLGGKGEGIIDLRELRSDKGELLVQPGESIDGYVLSLGEGTVTLTRSVPKGSGREVLAQAFESKLPVEGTVTGQNKGGLEVDLGGTRAFVPASQVDLHFVQDQSVFVGQKLKFLVMELRGGNAILSRRALLEEERAGKAALLRKSLEVGAVLEGTITGVRDFGAFVDLGGIEGLVHVSELSHQRVAHAQDVVKPGQKVKVQVLRIEKDEKGLGGASLAGDGRRPQAAASERIALSLRALEQDPWEVARPQLEEGKKLQGKVVRLQPFGAFVELFPGVDGLAHVSALSNKHLTHPREVVKEGEVIWVQIESIDDAQKRISLRRITEEEAQQEGPVVAPERGDRGARAGGRGEHAAAKDDKPAAKRFKVGDLVEATVDRCEVYGVFVKWEGGKGLLPNQEAGTPRGSDNKKVMPIGMSFKAQIIEIDERGRFRLSRTSAERAADRSDYEQYQRASKPAGKGFGTLGDLLRAKLAQQDE